MYKNNESAQKVQNRLQKPVAAINELEKEELDYIQDIPKTEDKK